MNIQLRPLTSEDKNWFIQSLQHSFKQAVLLELAADDEIISREEIEASMNSETAESLVIIADGEKVGGAVVQIYPETQRNSLDLFFVQTGQESKGIGLAAWQAIERSYPQTRVWETHTPYFEKRNIHFYVNKCGFKITEFYHAKHRHNETIVQDENPLLEELFKFEKVMK